MKKSLIITITAIALAVVAAVTTTLCIVLIKPEPAPIKVDVEVYEDILPPSIPLFDLTYDGSPKELLAEGYELNECGTFYYALKGGKFSTALPTAIMPGEYQPVWYFKGDKYHNDIGSKEHPIEQLYPVFIGAGDVNEGSVIMPDYVYGTTVPTPTVSGIDVSGKTVKYFYSDATDVNFGTSFEKLTPTTLEAGSYYVFAIVIDGNSATVTKESTMFRVTNPQ